MSMLSIKNVIKKYQNKQVIHAINMEVPAGAFVVIVGPSGCGKSTLLRMIAGLEDISEGEIAIAGKTVNNLEPNARGCAMVFQNYALYPHMSVAQNIAYPLKISAMPKQERMNKVYDAAKILGLENYLDRRPAQLSGGQRQRVAMGRAIVREPSIFLFDEPLSNLDAKLRVQMRIEIRKLHRRLAATSVFVTHDQIEAMTLADILVVMNKGKIEQIGTPSQIYNKPATSFVASFIGSPSMNLIRATFVNDYKAQLDCLPNTSISLPVQGKKGQSIMVGVRPEDIQLEKDEGKGLPVKLDLVEDMGGSMTGYFALGEQEIAAQLPKNFQPRNGQFSLTLPLSAITCFDCQTSRCIE
ncbi:ABC transporter ATP-binding protein [Bartonella tamiae]|uniref:ABC transporter domain-containing protein n=1 Tax=Bartonella tamiae Th239 TaxID=1094558 RepID=J0QY66_9HYPH|nr:sn-glycerol-3-phosphate ABC transporter ATP-binding protein UgpC [Bartonella tamiae]EJF91036.1 hypothetical protein ME5_00368 [Bartonella tamiae Th239]EJF93299.1 hypothetical protein MEG_01513 [Bartonella tamiae Th307]